jgi:hypothetical protein
MGGSVSRRRDDTQRPEKLVPVAAHRHSVTCITSFGEDGELMVTASEDRTICLWDLSVDGKYKRHWEMKALRGHGLQPDGSGAGDEDAPSHRRTVSSVQAGAMVSCPQPSRARDGHTHWVPHRSPRALCPLHTLMTFAYLCDMGLRADHVRTRRWTITVGVLWVYGQNGEGVGHLRFAVFTHVPCGQRLDLRDPCAQGCVVDEQ